MKHSFLAILTLGMLSLIPSSANALDLKKESSSTSSCVKRFKADYSEYYKQHYVCIDSANRITYNYGMHSDDAGKLGVAENKGGTIKQYEIQDGKLVRYKCSARNSYVLQCMNEVERSVFVEGGSKFKAWKNGSNYSGW